jgi:hypothetical protein
MKELRELVRQFVADEIDYAAFRRSMVMRFQSTRNADPEVRDAVNVIGDAFVDFSEGLLSEKLLKNRLFAFLPMIQSLDPINEEGSTTAGNTLVSAPSTQPASCTYPYGFLGVQIVMSGSSPMFSGEFALQTEFETWGRFGGTRIATESALSTRTQN